MGADKHFDATPSRLQRARREGDVARSTELCGAAAFGCALACIAAAVPHLASGFHAMLQSAVAGESPRAAGIFALFMLGPACGAACGAIGAAAIQTGGLPLRAVRIDVQRLNPVENLKRLCSRDAFAATARATAAFAVSAASLVPAFAALFAAALRGAPVQALAAIAWSGALRTCATACAIGLLFAFGDFGMQYAQWKKRLRMTHDELKRDQKEQDGDPLARSRRRTMHRRIARGSLTRVKDAAFVVTNPTHIAVALEYRPPHVAVPRVLVRAADEMALRVRGIAAGYGVPVVENVALARALYAAVRPGQSIPQETYVAVAEIVMQLRGAAAR